MAGAEIGPSRDWEATLASLPCSGHPELAGEPKPASWKQSELVWYVVKCIVRSKIIIKSKILGNHSELHCAVLFQST